MFNNICLLGFNLRSEDLLIKIIKENFDSINIKCIDEIIDDRNSVNQIVYKTKQTNHPLLNDSESSKIIATSDSKTLSIINLPKSFSESVAELINKNIPKIFSIDDYKIYETYFYQKSNMSSQIISTPITEKDLLMKIQIANYHTVNNNEDSKSKNIIDQGLLKIDTEKYLVTLEGKKIDLTFKELELLKFLASKPGRVFSRETLLKNVWDYDYYGGTRTVDVHVRRLRRKIEDHKYNFIETIWNVGYKFNE